MERPPPPDVEAVRSELRRLGYLESGLDRFVLAESSASTPLHTSLRVAGRLGLAGGVLLGVGLTLAAAGLDPRLREQPQDLAVLALYLSILAGAVVGLAAASAGLLAARLPRSAPRTGDPGRTVGLGFALAVLLYLALWWRSHGLDAPAAIQAMALVLATGLAVAFARFGSLAAVAVLAAAGAPDLPQATLSRRRVALLVAAAGLLLAVPLFAAWAGRTTPEVEPPALTVVPTGRRVVVVGIDGLEQTLAERWMEQGRMPRLRALRDRGAWAPLRAEPERVPAIVWTTIATGRGPEAHGIVSTGSRRLAGMRTAVSMGEPGPFLRGLTAATDVLRLTRPLAPSAAQRGAKAVWNVASEAGLRVRVVGWWATWPAETVNGEMITDRALVRLEKGGGGDRETAPGDLLDELRPLVPAPPSGDAVAVVAGRARALDTFAAAALTHLRTRPADLEAVYLPGLDIASVQLLEAEAPLDAASLAQRLDALADAAGEVERLLGDVAQGAGPDAVVMVVRDPGRRGRERAGASGLLVVTGPDVVPGAHAAVSARDVAPTVLHLLGLPISGELDGQPFLPAFTPAFRAAHPVRAVATYGSRPRSRPPESALDAQVLEELRALGYIK